MGSSRGHKGPILFSLLVAVFIYIVCVCQLGNWWRSWWGGGKNHSQCLRRWLPLDLFELLLDSRSALGIRSHVFLW